MQFFVQYIIKKHKNIKFSSKIELNGSLSFLDVKIFRENEKFVTSLYVLIMSRTRFRVNPHSIVA